MKLADGTRIGAYEIRAALGAGGMGEVYRARDTRLDRDVAIKVLPDAFAADPERVARFEREARTLAALNHPHVAHIYGVEEQRGVRALVMELVDGETLAERLARGALPLEDALPIARQIAEGLDAAHERGIVHRDLKPANIKLRPDGAVKVLDFGLAKAFERSGGSGGSGRSSGSGDSVEFAGAPRPGLPDQFDSPDLSASPTLTSPAGVTGVGVILGTAAYMSPEQAKGKPVDRRADIWAFGCVVFEMVTGRPPFSGETVSEVLARVIEREPDWQLLPVATPTVLRRVLQRCLQKNPAKRWQHMGDVALELDLASSEPANPEVNRAASRPRWRQAAGWLVAIVMAAAAGASWLRSGTAAPPPMTTFELSAPSGLAFGITQALPNAALAPDGRSLVFQGLGSGNASSLWIRTFDDIMPRELPNTEDGVVPFWSPDGRAIAFSRAGSLWRTDIGSGSPQVICGLPPGAGEGGAWGTEGTILLGSRSGGIFRVSAAGGTPQPVTSLDAGETSHHWPVWLPGEESFLYRTDKGSVVRATLDGAPSRKVLDADSRVEFVMPGLLLFAKGTALVAQPFDPATAELTGEQTIISETVRLGPTGRAMFSVRSNALVYRSGAVNEAGFTWDVYDQRGQVRQSLPLRILRSFALSPDGTQIALHSHDSGTGDGEFSLVQLASGSVTRIYEGALHYDSPVWGPDGTRLAVASNQGVRIIRTDRSGEGEPLVPDGDAPTDWVARGDWIVYSSSAPNTGEDILALSLSGDRKPRVLVQTRSDDRNGVVSADGEWLAYTSLESGRAEIYAQRFPAGGVKSAITSSGGSHARWDPKGAALYYWSPDERVMRVPVRVRDGVLQAAGEPVAVLALKNTGPQYGSDSTRSPYVLGPNGVGFIGAQGDGTAVDSILRVVLNWREQLARRAGNH